MVRFSTGLQSVHLFSFCSCELSLKFAACLREADSRLGKPASGRVSGSVSVCACAHKAAHSLAYTYVCQAASVCA